VGTERRRQRRTANCAAVRQRLSPSEKFARRGQQQRRRVPRPRPRRVPPNARVCG